MIIKVAQTMPYHCKAIHVCEVDILAVFLLLIPNTYGWCTCCRRERSRSRPLDDREAEEGWHGGRFENFEVRWTRNPDGYGMYKVRATGY